MSVYNRLVSLSTLGIITNNKPRKMFLVINILFGILLGGINPKEVVLATTLTYSVKALIDGSDTLIIKGNTLQWDHHDFAAVGRHTGRNEPTILSSTLNGSVKMNRVQWIPDWPNPVPDEIRFPAFSSVFSGLNPALPSTDTSVILTPILSRGSTRIEQLPSRNNDFTLRILYDDKFLGGADFYETEITVIFDEVNSVPEPTSPLSLIALGILGVASTLSSRLKPKPKKDSSQVG